jgi:hypothetical protein
MHRKYTMLLYLLKKPYTFTFHHDPDAENNLLKQPIQIPGNHKIKNRLNITVR